MQRAALGAVGLATIALVISLTERPAFSHKPITTPIIFKKEIAQIFQRKCFQCHSENNLAMSLTTYELARPWARAIREEILERQMPPWGAVHGFGEFANDIALTPREMDIILSWTDGGAPSGVTKAEENIPPVYVPSEPQWERGAPEEVIAMDTPFTVAAGSGDQVQRFDVRAAFTTPRSVKAIAFKPGDRRVVRYASLADAATGRWLASWTPWSTYFALPADVVYQLPARARLTLEIGYRATEETVRDKSELGLYFSDMKGTRDATTTKLTPTPAQTTGRAAAEKIRAELSMPASRELLAVWPELAEGTRAIELIAIAPDGVSEPLLWVKDVRRDWPTAYVFREPVSLAPGTRLVMTTYYAKSGEKPTTVSPAMSLVLAPRAARTSVR